MLIRRRPAAKTCVDVIPYQEIAPALISGFDSVAPQGYTTYALDQPMASLLDPLRFLPGSDHQMGPGPAECVPVKEDYGRSQRITDGFVARESAISPTKTPDSMAVNGACDASS